MSCSDRALYFALSGQVHSTSLGLALRFDRASPKDVECTWGIYYRGPPLPVAVSLPGAEQYDQVSEHDGSGAMSSSYEGASSGQEGGGKQGKQKNKKQGKQGKQNVRNAPTPTFDEQLTHARTAPGSGVPGPRPRRRPPRRSGTASFLEVLLSRASVAGNPNLRGMEQEPLSTGARARSTTTPAGNIMPTGGGSVATSAVPFSISTGAHQDNKLLPVTTPHQDKLLPLGQASSLNVARTTVAAPDIQATAVAADQQLDAGTQRPVAGPTGRRGTTVAVSKPPVDVTVTLSPGGGQTARVLSL